MGFINNDGEILLDAVLTDLGKRHTLSDNFEIVSFGIGDDEINYGLYDEDAPTETMEHITIMETPVYEPQIKGYINHGLLSLPGPPPGEVGILHLPFMRVNEKEIFNDLAAPVALPPSESAIPYGGPSSRPIMMWGSHGSDAGIHFYHATNTETGEKLYYDEGFLIYQIGGGYVEGGGPRIFVETGIEPAGSSMPGAGITATESNRRMYIEDFSLDDARWDVYVDARYFRGVYTPQDFLVYYNTAHDAVHPTLSPSEALAGSPLYNFGSAPHALAPLLPGVIGPTSWYRGTWIYTAEHRIYNILGTEISDREVSMINGPRANVSILGFELHHELTVRSTGTIQNELGWKSFTYGADLFGSGNLYDYADTYVYVRAPTTGASVEIPIRIIRYAGTT